MWITVRLKRTGVYESLDLSIDQQTSKQLTKGMQSFKVLAECPILVVSLFQAHRNIVVPNVRKFVPLIKGVLFESVLTVKKLLPPSGMKAFWERYRVAGEGGVGVREVGGDCATWTEVVVVDEK